MVQSRPAVDAFDRIVEQKLAAAVREGMFDNLPGAGRPLVLDPLDDVPCALRASYVVLRNHGMVPPELEARRAWLRLRDLLDACTDGEQRARLAPQVAWARLRYDLLQESRR